MRARVTDNAAREFGRETRCVAHLKVIFQVFSGAIDKHHQKLHSEYAGFRCANTSVTLMWNKL